PDSSRRRRSHAGAGTIRSTSPFALGSITSRSRMDEQKSAEGVVDTRRISLTCPKSDINSSKYGAPAMDPSYPATRYEPSPIVDLSAKVERERLSPGAIKAFLNIMGKWHVRDEDARVLLGGMSNGQFYEMKKNPRRTLDTDTLVRISYLIGIFKAL